MWNGEHARRVAALLRHPATWIGAAVVLGAVGSWMVFEPPDRHVARDSDHIRFGDLRDSPLPTLSLENDQAPSAVEQPAADQTETHSPSATRAVFLTVEPAATAAGPRTDGVEPAHWESSTTPAWLTGTIEEIND